MTDARQFDWEQARQRLADAERTLRERGSVSAAEMDRIYRERIHRLAQPLATEEREDTVGILIFLLGAARFAIPLADVVEVIARPKIASVPGAPPEIAGIIQVRGEVRAVCDLQSLMGLPRAGEPATGDSQVVLLHRDAREIGILADHTEDIRAVSNDKRKPAAPESVAGAWITEDFVTVLDTKSLFEKFQKARSL